MEILTVFRFQDMLDVEYIELRVQVLDADNRNEIINEPVDWKIVLVFEQIYFGAWQ